MIKAVSPLNECMAQLEQGKEMPAQGWSLAPWKYLSLAQLILVVIGVKLARVDMVLKGKETTSHLLCKVSFQSTLFPLQL